jgi:hypothetical protein
MKVTTHGVSDGASKGVNCDTVTEFEHKTRKPKSKHGETLRHTERQRQSE